MPNPRVAVFLGLRYDFYDAFAEFPIWRKLADFWRGRTFFHELKSLVGCHKCGRIFEVDYSVNLDPSKGRVGDHYANCCLNCATDYLEQWKQYQEPQRYA